MAHQSPNSKGTSPFVSTLTCRHQHSPSMASPPVDSYHLAVFSFAHSPVTPNPNLTVHQVIPHHSASAEPVWPPQLQLSISSSQSHRRVLLSPQPRFVLPRPGACSHSAVHIYRLATPSIALSGRGRPITPSARTILTLRAQGAASQSTLADCNRDFLISISITGNITPF